MIYDEQTKHYKRNLKIVTPSFNFKRILKIKNMVKTVQNLISYTVNWLSLITQKGGIFIRPLQILI